MLAEMTPPAAHTAPPEGVNAAEVTGPADVTRSVRRVIVFKDILLPFSETFIHETARALQRYKPVYAGVRLQDGIALPPADVEVVAGGGRVGKLSEAVFKLTSVAPGFYRRLAKRRASLIHAHFGQSGMLAGAVAKRLGLPLIVNFHGMDVTRTTESLIAGGYLDRSYGRNRVGALSAASLFVTTSEYIRRRAIDLGFEASRVRTHYMGIDCDRFRPDDTVRRESVVLYVGRFVEKKGLRDVVAAMAIVRRERPDARLVLIGDGPLRGELEAQSAANGCRADFLGRRSPGEIATWMRRATVFYAPSVIAPNGDAEGLGMVFLEAQACGLPVVSTRSGGIPEAVAEGEGGLLTDEHDVAAQARAVIALLADPQLFARQSSAGRARMCREFDLHRQTQKLEAIYDSVIAAPTPGLQPDHRRADR